MNNSRTSSPNTIPASSHLSPNRKSPIVNRKFLLLLPLLLLTGCNTIYLPAGLDTNPPQTTPLRVTERRDYIGGDINVSNGYNPDESNVHLRAYYAAADGGSWWRLSGSGFVYGGNYEVTQAVDSTLHGNRLYVGVGGIADINLSLPIDEHSIGVGGLVGGIVEFGPYSEVWRRNKVSFTLPLIGVYAFFNARFSNGNQAGLQFAYGLPGFVSGNVQVDLGQYLLSAGTGLTFASREGVQDPGRIAIGAAYRLR